MCLLTVLVHPASIHGPLPKSSSVHEIVVIARKYDWNSYDKGAGVVVECGLPEDLQRVEGLGFGPCLNPPKSTLFFVGPI